MAITQILDDRDPALVYSSGWARAGSSNEYNGTTSSANDPGLTATLAFQGVQVSVYGTLGPRDAQKLSPQSNYSIDGGSSVTYQAVQSPTIQYSTRFYTSPLLPNGQHTLVVTNLITSDSLFLDYFIVLRDNNNPSPLIGPTPTPDKHPDGPPPPPPSKPPSSPNTGTIVGSALGAAALVILAVAVMLWLRGRNRRREDLDDTRVTSFRDNRSVETNLPFRHTILSVGSTYPTTSDSAPNSHSGQQQYDPYDPSPSAPPPGYVPEISEQTGVSRRVLPRLYLPSKFTREQRPIPSTAT